MSDDTDQGAKAGRGLGETGEAVRVNIKRVRDELLRIPVTELSRRLDDLGRPIPPLGLRRIEDGTRRVDADDLVAIAVALGVSPVTLLMPATEGSNDAVALTGVAGQVDAWHAWQWLRAEQPLAEGDELRFWDRALPGWHAAKMVERIKERQEVMDKIDAGLKKNPDGDDK